MAIMYPGRIDCFCEKQPGEILTYIFLRDTLPDDHYVFWNIKPTEDQELDFLVLSPDIGLIVLEVKDWYKLEQEELELRNPKIQGMRYIKSIVSRLQNNKELLQTSEGYENNLKFFYSYGIVFPYLYQEQLSDKEYYFKDKHLFLLKDDFALNNSDRLREKLYLMGSKKFVTEKLTEDEINLIIDIILDEEALDENFFCKLAITD